MGPGSGSSGFQGCQDSAHIQAEGKQGLMLTIFGEFQHSPISIAGKIIARVVLNRLSLLVQHNGVILPRESMRLSSWSGYHRHNLRCTSDSREVPQTTSGSLHDFYRPNQGLRLCSQGRSPEGSEEYWMSRQVRQHCEILPRWHDGMFP